MPEQRAPVGVVVNGAYLFVKDATGAAGIFSNWQRVTGLSSFTLPAEVGGTTETQLMDGNLQAAAIAGVGTVTGAIGGRGVHMSQLFMEERKLDGAAVAIAIVKAAVVKSAILLGNTHNAVAAATLRSIDIPAARRSDVLNRVRAGDIVGLDLDGAMAPTGLADWKATAAAALDDDWQGVAYVEDDGSYIDVAPGFSAAQATTTDTASLLLRTPGVQWIDVTGTINGFDGGDFQNGQQLSGNFTFTPSSALPRVTPEYRTVAQIATLYTKGSGYVF